MKTLILSGIVATSVMGASLIDEAKTAGLKPIPANPKAVEKLTSNPKNRRNEKNEWMNYRFLLY